MIDLDAEPPVTDEYLGDNVWSVSQGKARLLYGRCDEGCSWTLAPDYRAMRIVVRHGDNPEHALVLDRLDDSDAAPRLALEEIAAWLDRVHDHEVAAQQPSPGDRDAGKAEQCRSLRSDNAAGSKPGYPSRGS